MKKISRNMGCDEINDYCPWRSNPVLGKDIIKDTDTCIQIIEESICDKMIEGVSDNL